MTMIRMDDDADDSAAGHENYQSPRGPHAVSAFTGHRQRAGMLLWGTRPGLPNHAGDGLAASHGLTDVGLVEARCAGQFNYYRMRRDVFDAYQRTLAMALTGAPALRSEE